MRSLKGSLRGYGFPIHKRDGFKCVYGGLDGTKRFSAWLCLAVDHLLPKGYPGRDKAEYQATACRFCNEADNHYFRLAKKRGLTFHGKSCDQLIAQRKPYVLEKRESFSEFWEAKVRAD